MVSDVRELGVEGVLDAVESWHATRTEADAAIFVAAAHFADLHHPDSRRAETGPVLPGSERGIRIGGAGTPTVLEFAPAEFAARIGKSPYAGRALVADALDVRHRLPRLWARVCAGEVPVFFARHVALKTRELSESGAAQVDAGVVGYADGRITGSRFETLVAAKVVEADPEAAAERERLAAEEEFVKVGRCNEHGQKTMYVKSTSGKILRMWASITFFADGLGELGHPGTEDQRNTDGLLTLSNPPAALQLMQARDAQRTAQPEGAGDPAPDDEPDTLDDPDDPDDPDDQADDTNDEGDAGDANDGDAGDANDGDAGDANDGDAGDANDGDAAGQPGKSVARFLNRFRPHQIRPDSRFTLGFDPRKLLPAVTLYLHLYARTDTGDVGPVTRWEGEGPVSTAYVRDLLGPACEFTIKPVIDPAGMAPVDAYEIPDRHREAVHLRTPADVFPYAANTTRRMQIDHTKPYLSPDHGGPPGQTGLENLGPMTGFHHRIKTHGRWQVKQPFPGIFLWRDPHGRCYLVDHTGTRKLGKTGSGKTLPEIPIDVIPPTPGVALHYTRTHAA